MKLIVFLALFAFATHATTLQTDIAASLADLNDHPFAQSIASLVTMNMKTGGPLHELRTLL